LLAQDAERSERSEKGTIETQTTLGATMGLDLGLEGLKYSLAQSQAKPNSNFVASQGAIILVAQRRAEEELTEMRTRLMQEEEKRQSEWNAERDRREKELKELEDQLAERKERLGEKQAELAAEEERRETDLRMRGLENEEARRRTAQALEGKVRAETQRELRHVLTDQVRSDMTARITLEVQSELQKEFEAMCGDTRDKVERDRALMEKEVREEVTKSVQKDLRETLRQRLSGEVERAVAGQLSEVRAASSLLRSELRRALDERDVASAALAAARAGAESVEQRLQSNGAAERDATSEVEAEFNRLQESLSAGEEQRVLYALFDELGVGDLTSVQRAAEGEWRSVADLMEEARAAQAELQLLRDSCARRAEEDASRHVRTAAGEPPAPPLTALGVPSDMKRGSSTALFQVAAAAGARSRGRAR